MTGHDREWRSVAEAAREANVSESTVRNWIARKQVTYKRTGGRVQVDMGDVRRRTAEQIIEAEEE
jgi:excisionase family DNA binding protein